jgi:hypothetical protein
LLLWLLSRVERDVFHFLRCSKMLTLFGVTVVLYFSSYDIEVDFRSLFKARFPGLFVNIPNYITKFECCVTTCEAKFACWWIEYWSSELKYWSSELKYWSSELKYRSSELKYWSSELKYWSSELKYWSSELKYWSSELKYWSSELKYWSSVSFKYWLTLT